MIEQTIKSLPREQVIEIQAWLADYVEDFEELQPGFVARPDRAQQQLDDRKGRVVTL